jgi:phospholipid/cholesterol/gamma-HCH transport system substrate-binding protein
MSVRKPIVGLSIFLVVAMVVSWMVLVTLRREVGGHTNTFSAIFTDASGMHPGDDVRVAGVRVGRVDKVELEGTRAKVTFRVAGDQTLYTNTVASVTYQNIIGQRYLGLSPGEPGEERILPPGSTIPEIRTVPSFDIAHLLNGFEPLFTTLDPEQVDNLTNAVVKAFQGDEGSVLTLLTQSSALADRIVGPDDLLGKTIVNLNEVVTKLAAQSDDVQGLLEQTSDVLATLGSRREQLVENFGSINATVSRLAAITDAVFPATQELITRRPGAAAHILANPDRFAYSAQNVPYVLKGIARTSEFGAYMNTYVCNANVSIFAFMGRLTSGLTRLMSPGNVVRNSPVCR